MPNVTVNAQLNFDQTVTTTDRYIKSKLPPVSQTTTKETYTGSGNPNAAGTLGSTGTAGSGSKSGTYSNTSTTVNNALGTTRTRVANAPGSVKNLSIAVALDSNVKNLDVGGITNLVKSGSGYNAARGDTLAVQSLPFSKTGQLAGGATPSTTASPSNLMGMIKQGALAALVLAVLVGVFLASRKSKKKPAVADDDVLSFPEDGTDGADAGDTAAAATNVTDLRGAAERRRRALASAAGDHPQDVARVLTSWLNTKESGS